MLVFVKWLSIWWEANSVSESEGKIWHGSKTTRMFQLIETKQNREIKTGEVLCNFSNVLFSARLFTGNFWLGEGVELVPELLLTFNKCVHSWTALAHSASTCCLTLHTCTVLWVAGAWKKNTCLWKPLDCMRCVRVCVSACVRASVGLSPRSSVCIPGN